MRRKETKRRLGLLAAGLATVLILVSGRPIRATSGVSRPDGTAGARTTGILAGLPLVDSSSSASGIGKSLSWSHKINPGSDRLLIVGTSNAEGAKTITGITYGTASLTRVGSRSGGGNKNHVEIWYLIAPPVGKATITATVSEGDTKVVSGALGLTGVDQTTPVTGFVSAQGQGLTATLNVTSAAQQLVVDVLSADGNADTTTAAAGQTVRWNTSTGSGAVTYVARGAPGWAQRRSRCPGRSERRSCGCWEPWR